MIKMIVFDMAGTTVDEDNIVYKTLRKALLEEGFNFSLKTVLEIGAGKEKKTAIKDILQWQYPNVDDYVIEDVYTIFKNELVIAYNKNHIKPQLGAVELFLKLKQKGILVVLNTGYNVSTAQSILNKLDWQIGRQIDALITASDVKNNRPQPDMILLAMKKFNLTDAKAIVKIGDSIIDIEEGKNAGCALSIGVTTGAHTYEQLLTAQPDYIIDNLVKLLPLINEYDQQLQTSF
jgi:phosphonatase-like hydrolase